jgi:hypothetical protein
MRHTGYASYILEPGRRIILGRILAEEDRRETTMKNGSLVLRLAGTVALSFFALAGDVFAQQQQDGPLPQVPAVQAQVPAQNAPAQNPSESPKPAMPSDTAQTAATVSAAANAAPSPAVPANAKVEVPGGTHIPLVLHNAISTRSARPGDPVYFETLFPVMIDGHVVIPAGSYVSGEVSESKRPGRVKGRGELMIRLKTLILPNAYMVNLNAVPSNAGTGGNETTDKEGKIVGDSNKPRLQVPVSGLSLDGALQARGLAQASVPRPVCWPFCSLAGPKPNCHGAPP